MPIVWPPVNAESLEGAWGPGTIFWFSHCSLSARMSKDIAVILQVFT